MRMIDKILQILDGKTLGKEIQEEIRLEVEKLGKKPHLAVVLVGEDSASKIYVNTKNRTCEKLGFKSTVINLPATISEEELKKKKLRLLKFPHTTLIFIEIFNIIYMLYGTLALAYLLKC